MERIKFGGCEAADPETERRLARDLEREPGLRHRRPRVTGQLALEVVAGGFRASTEPLPGRCFACEGRAIGTRDLRLKGGRLEAACVLHADGTGGRP